MIDVGVSDIAIYIPQFYLPHEDLAEARGIPPEKFHEGLGNYKMSILPNWEDSVTMAANAAAQLLEKTGTNPQEIHQLVVSTESGVDHSKPVASFVQGLLEIGVPVPHLRDQARLLRRHGRHRRPPSTGSPATTAPRRRPWSS